MKTNITLSSRERRRKRIRSKIAGTEARPRLSVFKSNAFIYAQLIDDAAQVTLASASDMLDKKGTKMERAAAVGKKIAEVAQKKNITEIVFDRNGFKYSGRIKTLADSARAAGLKF